MRHSAKGKSIDSVNAYGEKPEVTNNKNGILLVTNIPTPYRVPLFNELALQLRNKGMHLTVVFGAASYPRRDWEIDWRTFKFDHEVLGGRPRRVGRFESYVFTYPGLIRKVRREKPLVVITGGFSIASTMLSLTRRLTGARCVIWSGELPRRHRSIVATMRDLQRRLLVRRADALVAYGSGAAKYLRGLGAREERIATAINTVDVEFFSGEAPGPAATATGTTKCLLAVTTLVPRKQPETLIHLAAALSARRNDFRIEIIGDGPERASLEKLAMELGVADRVVFEGYIQRGEIARRLRVASCFLFPTAHDIWGLVLIEAMAAGLPCLASVHAGATEDLIEHGETGYAVDFSGTENVARIVEYLLDNPGAASRIGRLAQDFVRTQASLAVSARGFVQAIETALDRGA